MWRKQTGESIPSFDTDTQQYEAAPQQLLRAGHRQRLAGEGTALAFVGHTENLFRWRP